MSQRTIRRLTMIALTIGLLHGQSGFAADVIPSAAVGASSAIEFLRNEGPFLFSDSDSGLNGYLRTPSVQTMTMPLGLWRDSPATANDMDDSNGFDEAGILFGSQRQNDPWLMMLVGAGLLIFFGNWLWFGGVLGKASVVAAALLIAGGLAIAFVREWWMKR